MRTEAAVLVGPRHIEVRDFEVPGIGPDDGLLEVEACGICGSDLKPYLTGGGPAGWPRRIDVPVILGHEVVGRIARVGRQAAERWKVAEGDRVVVERWLPCGRCEACRTAAFQHCVRHIEGADLFYGGTPATVSPGLWGGFARHMYLHPDTVLSPVRSDVPADVYPLFMPLANAVSWVCHTGNLKIGESILIQGPGPIGLACVLVARAVGARRIIVSGLGRDSARLGLARRFGATDVIDAESDDVAQRCLDLTGGAGAHLVVDVTTSRTLEPVATAVAAARRRGRVVLASEHDASDGEPGIMSQILAKTLTVTGVRSRGREAVAVALDLLGDDGWAADLLQLCSPVVGLADVASGFEALLAGDAVHASMSLATEPGAVGATSSATKTPFARK